MMTQMTVTSLAEKCYHIRKAFGWTQCKMAQMICSTQAEISFIERGFIPRDCAKVIRIEELYVVIVARVQ